MRKAGKKPTVAARSVRSKDRRDELLKAAAAVTEANRVPDLVKSFYEHGPCQAASRLAEVLEAADRRGEIRISDCARAAGHFVGMIRDNLHLQVVLGLRPAPSQREVHAAVDSAVEISLNGVCIVAEKPAVPRRGGRRAWESTADAVGGRPLNEVHGSVPLCLSVAGFR